VCARGLPTRLAHLRAPPATSTPPQHRDAHADLPVHLARLSHISHIYRDRLRLYTEYSNIQNIQNIYRYT